MIRVFSILTCLAFALASIGCQSTGQVTSPTASGSILSSSEVTKVAYKADDLADIVFDPPGVRDFRQSDQSRRSGAERTYKRETMASGRVEGSLIGRIEFPLSDYLDPHSTDENRKLSWPATPGKQVDALFIEFKPPVMEWPRLAEEGDVSESRAQMTIYDSEGKPFLNGTAHRSVTFASVGPVEAGGRQWNDAIQMKAQTELSFGWVGSMRMTETAWFAPDVGLVRRHEQFSGRALWLFRFYGNSRYEAAPRSAEFAAQVVQPGNGGYMEGTQAATASDQPQPFEGNALAIDRLWSILAVCVERTGRRIRVSGLAVEWAVETPSLAIAK